VRDVRQSAGSLVRAVTVGGCVLASCGIVIVVCVLYSKYGLIGKVGVGAPEFLELGHQWVSIVLLGVCRLGCRGGRRPRDSKFQSVLTNWCWSAGRRASVQTRSASQVSECVDQLVLVGWSPNQCAD